MAPLTAYGTYGLWHQLWLFTCGVTLVGLEQWYCIYVLEYFFSACFGTTPLAIIHVAIGLGVEEGVLTYLIQPNSHSVVIHTPPGPVDPG